MPVKEGAGASTTLPHPENAIVYMFFKTGLVRHGSAAIRANCDNSRRVIGSVHIKNVLRVVDDRIRCRGHPVASRILPKPLQIRKGRVRITFKQKHHEVVASFRAKKLIHLWQNAGIQVLETRRAPSPIKMKNHGLASVQIALKVVFNPADVVGCPIPTLGAARERNLCVSLKTCLTRFSQSSIGANRINRGVIRPLVIVKDCPGVVNDGIRRCRDPVADRCRAGAIQVRLGRGVVTLHQENVDVVGAVGAIRLVHLLEDASVVVIPIGRRPSGRELKNDGFSLIQQALHVPLDPVDVCGGPVRSDASVRQLGKGLQREKGRNEQRKQGFEPHDDGV